jgi:protein-tyrosine-phosphatase
MTRAHQQSILALMPSAAGRVQLLSGRGEDIVDPKGGSLETYRRARDQIAACLRDVVKLVARSGV